MAHSVGAHEPTTPVYYRLPDGQAGRVYNEAAFRRFLAVTRRRGERLLRSPLLVLVTLRRRPGALAALPDATAADLFGGLGASIRETDFVGWFREGRVAAAVLPQDADPSSDAPRVVAARLVRALGSRLPASQAERLRVRVVRLGGRADAGSQCA